MESFLHIVEAVFVAIFLYYLLVVKHVVREFECGLQYRNGRFRRQLSPGGHWLLRPWTKVVTVDLRKRVATVPGQEVLTADQVGLKVSLVVTYEVADPAKAMHEIENYANALYVAAQLGLRKVVGSLPIDRLLEQRMAIGAELTSEVKFVAESMGLSVHSVEVKDVMLPADLRKSFSEVIRATKEGQAALERARGETAALRSLANAARMLEDNPALLNLRTLQILSSSTSGHTIVLNTDGGIAPLKKTPTPPTGPSST